jgi:hypothetical protein
MARCPCSADCLRTVRFAFALATAFMCGRHD